MVTTQITVKGQLTEDGQVKIDLPEGWQAGEIAVQLQVEHAVDDVVWTQEELQELEQYFQFKGGTLGDIPEEIIGAGADWDIGDSAEWVEEQRRKRAERNRTRWME